MSPVPTKGGRRVPKTPTPPASIEEPQNPPADGQEPEMYEISEATAARVDQLNHHLQKVLAELNAKADEIARIYLEAIGVKLEKGDRVDFNADRTHIQVYRAKKKGLPGKLGGKK